MLCLCPLGYLLILNCTGVTNTELLYLYDVQIVQSINQQTGYFSKKQQQQQKLCHSSLGFSLTIHIFYVAVGGFL